MQELNSTSPYQIHAFSTSLLNSILGRFSKINPMKLGLGYIIMVNEIKPIKPTSSLVKCLEKISGCFMGSVKIKKKEKGKRDTCRLGQFTK